MRYLLWIAGIFCLLGCRQELPRLGPKEEGQLRPIRAFELVDQTGSTFSDEQLIGRCRVANFFFTSCPTICPVVQREMQRIQEQFADEDRLVFLSHTIDPKRDTPERLREYARGLGLDRTANWHFLTGSKDHLYDLARDYWNVAYEDSSAPGGFNHSGRIVLVDSDGYIRAFATGTNPVSVDTLIHDIHQLLRSH